jgi:hypothetical protein
MNKTTPESVEEANWGLFHASMNLPAAAFHCGMTQKEMKMTFREFLKYHPPTYDSLTTVHSHPKYHQPSIIINEID